MRIFILTIVFGTFFTLAEAQWAAYNKKTAQAFLERPLKVIVDEHFADEFKEVIQNEYKAGNPSIDFITTNEAETLQKTEPEKYSFLKITNGLYVEYIGTVRYETNAAAIVGFTQKGKKKIEYAMRVPFNGYPLSKLDLKIAVRQFNVYVKAYSESQYPVNIEGDIEKLKEKTLLIPKELVKEGISDQELIAEYDGKAEVKPWSDIVDIINSGNSEYAFIYIIIAANGLNPSFAAIDVGNFDVLSLTTFGGLYLGYKISTDMGNSRTEKSYYWPVNEVFFKPVHLNGLTKKFAQKLNRKKIPQF